MVRYDLGEIADTWILVEERDGGNLTCTVASFEVFDSDDVSVQASANATIAGSGTDEVLISGEVDTTAQTGTPLVDVFEEGSAYYVKFTYEIGTETYIDIVHILITETRL